MNIPVVKVWKSEDDAEFTRPKSITVKLLADKEDSGKSLELSEDNDWSGIFEDLPAQKDGKVIEYTVEEVAVEYYTSEVTGSMEEGFTITNTCTYIKTGDESNLLLWSAAMMASMAGVGVTIYKKKREEDILPLFMFHILLITKPNLRME